MRSVARRQCSLKQLEAGCEVKRVGISMYLDRKSAWGIIDECFEWAKPRGKAKPKTKPSQQFTDTWKLLVEYGQSIHGAKWKPSAVPVCVKTGVDETAASELCRRAALKGAQVAKLTACDAFLVNGVVSSWLLRTLSQLPALGVTLTYVGFDENLKTPDRVDADSQFSFWQSALQAKDDHRERSAFVQFPVNSCLQIPCFSALAASDNVANVRVETMGGHVVERKKPGSTRQSWQWLALALLSTMAPQRVKTLSIGLAEMTMNDIESIERVMRHPNPLQLLLPDVTSAELQFVSLKHGAKAFPRQETPAGHGFMLQRTWSRVAVVSDESSVPRLQVLLPGYGVCWVERSDTSPTHPSELQHSRAIVDQLEVWELGKSSSDAILRLLETLGRDIRRLVIRSTRSGIAEDWLRQALSYLPNLEELSFQRSSISSLQQAIEVLDNLESLAVVTCELADSSLLQLLKLLADDQVPKSASLKHLKLTPHWRSREDEWQGVLDALLTTLQQNKRISECIWGVGRDFPHKDKFLKAFSVFHGEVLSSPQQRACVMLEP